MDNIANISTLTFIESSDEEDDPFFGANFENVEQADGNSYGRPVQKVPLSSKRPSNKDSCESPYYT